MTQAPSPQTNSSKAAPKSKQSEGSKQAVGNLTKISPKRGTKPPKLPPQKQKQQGWSLQVKTTALAIALSTLPVLAVGTASYLGSQSIYKQITQARQADATRLTETEIALQRQLLLLLIGTGVTAVLAGAIAALLANRAIHPVLNAAAVSTAAINRLRREDVALRDRVAGKDELVALETNIKLIEEQLPNLLWNQEAEAERTQVLMNITRRIWESLSEADVLKATVEEVRKAFKIDRVVVFRFDTNRDGTFIEESVASNLPKMSWAKIDTPFFEGRDIEQYRNGCVLAVGNIYQADLTDSQIGLLERFAVKANLISPIIKDNQLFGLLIAHQCSEPRYWQQSEINVFAQLATQVGFALAHVELLEQVDTKANQGQVFIDISRRIRESLNEEDILKTTVEEVRKAIRTERVLVYSFDNNWYGTVIAESVLPGFPKAMWAQIKDPCFAEGYIKKYQAGRVQATNNIYAAGLTDCHLKQLEPFAVKANLVAPILKDGYLFGLLIAHECSKPREWQQSEINLFTQLATQVGFALDHARLLNQVEQAYQAASATSHEQRQQKEALQRQVAELLRVSEIAVQSLSNESLSQLESVTLAYKHIQAVDDLAQKMITTVQQAELQIQQANQTVQIDRETMSRNANTIVAVRQAILVVSEKVKRLDQPAQKLFKVVNLISNVTSQLKLYAMNTRLAAARTNGDACQELDSIAEKVLSSVQQLDENTAEIQSLVARIQAEIQQAGAVIQDGTEQAIAGTQLMEETQQNLNRIAAFSVQISSLVEEIAQAANNQTQASTFAGQAILELANIASNTSEQSMSVAKSFNQLAAAAQEL